MENVIFLIFRRMRAPLLTLIVAYTIAILGLVLIPGQDADGNPWRMDFFHAFYVVSYTATTIGFGEIPYEFTGAQRFWVILSIYATVVVWFYSLGTLIALVQDKNFQRAVIELKFARRVRRRREPFYLVCGYGETGTVLVRALTDRNRQAVTIDIDEQRIDLLKLENMREYVPALCADARRPEHLLEAGLRHGLCAGVVALTNVNETNLKIAIAAKLMRPGIKVICRADSHDVEDNMASFGTDHIYDPFDIFALYLITAIQAPCLTLIHEWLTALPGDRLREPIYPPARGLWVLCGYGRFGRAVYRHLRSEGLELAVVEEDLGTTGKPGGRCVVGRGTEAVTLEQADIRRAVGLVAGTDNDADNLSIVMTALQLNSDLFVVARQNHLDNQELFDAVGADIVMHPSSIVANRIRVLLGTPLLTELESYALHQDDAWACQLVSRIAALVHEHVPEVWEISIDEENAYAVVEAVSQGAGVTLANLLRDPRNRDETLPAIPLLLLRRNERQLLPEENMRLRRGDRLLLCGRPCARSRMGWTLQNIHALSYILTGNSPSGGWLWRRIFKQVSGRRNGGYRR
ncbi:MAG: NAD-binding protein [Chromatiaceae bacterium]|jgi:Trk K+ transport system NAD-binding subunit|nr:NAD-binding protein [Chromatiaceae bacterium]